MNTIQWLAGHVEIDWAARDREIRRQLSEGDVIDLDKINAAATITHVVPK